MSRITRTFEDFELDITDPQNPYLVRGRILVKIKPQALQLLVLLTSRPGIFKREQIYAEFWDYDSNVSTNMVDKVITFLRQALAAAGGDGEFVTRISGGVIFCKPVGLPPSQLVTDPLVPQPSVTLPVEQVEPERVPQPIAALPEQVEPARVPRLIVTLPDAQVEAESLPAGGELTLGSSGTQQASYPIPRPSVLLFASTKLAVLILAVLTAAGGAYEVFRVFHSSSPAVPSVFVLPVVDHSVQNGNQPITDGITDELVTDIDRFARGRIFVFPWADSIQYKRKNPSPRLIHQEVGADYVLSTAFHDNGIGLTLDVRLYRMDGKPDPDPYIGSFPTDAKSMQREAASILASDLVRHILRAPALGPGLSPSNGLPDCGRPDCTASSR